MLLYLSFKFCSSWQTLSSGKIHFIDYILKRRIYILVNFENAHESSLEIKTVLPILQIKSKIDL